MQNIMDIRHRIRSVQETAQITKAMELISVSKLKRATDKYEKNVRYYVRVYDTIKDILNHKGDISHPYLEHRSTQRVAFVIVAGDNGMAGDYNRRILSYALEEIKSAKETAGLFIIGQMANEFFSRLGMTPDVEFLYCAQDPSLEDARRIATDLVTLYDDNLIDEVRLVFTAVGKTAGHAPTVVTRRLLPLMKEDFQDARIESLDNAVLDFEPSAEEVFNILVPQYILGLTYSCLIQAVLCEHRERIDSMHQATENAGEMLALLSREYHRARQAQITTELAELSASHGKKEG